jgi:hypothetical protein
VARRGRSNVLGQLFEEVNKVMSENKTFCGCGTVEDLASQRKSPIAFDKNLHEYDLVVNGGKVHYRMYYCFFCGGALPESKRASLFAEPSAQEMMEVAELISKAKSIEEVIQVLGSPDETVKAPKVAAGENGMSEVKTHYRYLRRWKTLDLTIREHKDGSIDSAFTGKYLGDSSHSAKTA